MDSQSVRQSPKRNINCLSVVHLLNDAFSFCALPYYFGFSICPSISVHVFRSFVKKLEFDFVVTHSCSFVHVIISTILVISLAVLLFLKGSSIISRQEILRYVFASIV